MRAAFLDKDGTLVKDVPYNVDPSRVALCPGVIEGLRLLQRRGYALIVVSNQPGIAQGYFGEEDLLGLERHLDRVLRGHGIALDGFYHCPHSPHGRVARYATLCTCRKPMPGMLLRAAREHGVDCGRSWMIGDILNDVEAGRRAGCRTVLIDCGNETEWEWSALRSPDVIVRDFHAAAKAIVQQDDGRVARPEEAMRK
ncbi:MAG TPA: HAD family hydrolase [Paucimonas sp.]|nr:HAD family hydrolase [Paucimonas sp.]